MSAPIPCLIMRGGTSRGPYFLASDLPADRQEMAKVLLEVMGTGDAAQVNGIGGGSSLNNKVAVVSLSNSGEADLDYLFAQVNPTAKTVDFSPSCGNMLSAVLPFAVETGIWKVTGEQTSAKVKNLNTNSIIEVVMETKGGQLSYAGDVRIDGVEGSGSPIILNFLDVAGTKTGKLLPTGNLIDEFEGVTVSCVDAAVPMVLIPAESLGVSGHESKEELDENAELMERIESIRRAAGLAMGLGEVAGKVVPKVSLVSEPQFFGNVTSRYFVPDTCHAAHAVTGAVCVAVASVLEGSVCNKAAMLDPQNPKQIVLEHPSGTMEIQLVTRGEGAETLVDKAGLVRTARLIFKGEIVLSD